MDNLTGLLSRTEFDKLIANTGKNQYVAELNIKSLQSVNDCCGHEVGDELIKTYSKALLNEVSYNNLYRYMGNSFMIVFDYRDIKEVLCEITNINSDIIISVFGRNSNVLDGFKEKIDSYKKSSSNAIGELYLKKLSLCSEFNG